MRNKEHSLLATIAFWSALLIAGPVPVQAAAAKIAIGPYLQNPAPDGMTVMFCTDAPGKFAVAYGSAADRLDRKVAARQCGEDTPLPHKARIAGLTPGSRCFYRIIRENGGEALSPVASFATLNPRADAVTAVFFNDLHDNVRLMDALRPQWKGVNPDFMFFNGDCWADPQRGKTEKTLAGIVPLCPAASRPLLLVRGNHEWRGPWQEGLLNCFDLPLGQEKKYYFALTQGPVRFVCLDCGEDQDKRMDFFQPYRKDELEWIKKEVAGDEFRQAKHRVLVVHIPLYGAPAHKENASPPSHKMWSPVLNEAGFDLCISGHDHRPCLLEPNDPRARWESTPPQANPYPVMIGGGPALGGGDAGTVIVLRADQKDLRASCTRVDGKVLFEYRKPPAAKGK